MKTISQTIRTINVFPVMPWKENRCNYLYPYMHNLFIDPLLYTISKPDDNTGKILVVMGRSDDIDPDYQNAVFYAGTMGKNSCFEIDWPCYKRILFLNQVPSDCLPEDAHGGLHIQLDGKNLLYMRNGQKHYTSIDLSMIYFDDQAALNDPLLHDTILALDGCQDESQYLSAMMKEAFDGGQSARDLVRTITGHSYAMQKSHFWQRVYPMRLMGNDIGVSVSPSTGNVHMVPAHV